MSRSRKSIRACSHHHYIINFVWCNLLWFLHIYRYAHDVILLKIASPSDISHGQKIRLPQTRPDEDPANQHSHNQRVRKKQQRILIEPETEASHPAYHAAQSTAPSSEYRPPDSAPILCYDTPLPAQFALHWPTDRADKENRHPTAQR